MTNISPVHCIVTNKKTNYQVTHRNNDNVLDSTRSLSDGRLSAINDVFMFDVSMLMNELSYFEIISLNNLYFCL